MQYSLKTKYREQRNKLGETGAGLIDRNEKDQIIEDSKLGNIFDKIQKDFPWYEQMNKLMYRSPLVGMDAISNSASNVDMSVLKVGNTGPETSQV